MALNSLGKVHSVEVTPAALRGLRQCRSRLANHLRLRRDLGVGYAARGTRNGPHGSGRRHQYPPM